MSGEGPSRPRRRQRLGLAIAGGRFSGVHQWPVLGVHRGDRWSAASANRRANWGARWGCGAAGRKSAGGLRRCHGDQKAAL